MPIKVTLDNGKVVAVEGSPEEAAAFLREMTSPSPTKQPTLSMVHQIDQFLEGPIMGPEPPASELIAAYLRGLPKNRHTMTNILMHFAQTTLSSRMEDGSPNLLYSRWISAAKNARALIEIEKGKTFEVLQEGKKRIYYLP